MVQVSAVNTMYFLLILGSLHPTHHHPVIRVKLHYFLCWDHFESDQDKRVLSVVHLFKEVACFLDPAGFEPAPLW